MSGVPPGGTTPASAFLPNPHLPTEEPPVILADRINEETGDFASLVEGQDPTDAAVQLTFSVERGSGAAARHHGHRFKSLRHQNELSEASVASLAEEATAHLADAGDVRIERVEVRPRDPGIDEHAEVAIGFRNLRTGEEIRRSVGGGA